MHKIRDWIHGIIQDGRDFLPSFILAFRSLVVLRDRFKIFEEWKNFLPVKDLVIPRLQAVIGLSERFLERNQLVSGG